MTTTLKFFYNGIKCDGGKLQGSYYDYGGSYPKNDSETITIYARKYSGFSTEIQDAFSESFKTSSMSNYFETDRIRVFPSHPLYADVLAAYNKSKAKRQARMVLRPATTIKSV